MSSINYYDVLNINEQSTQKEIIRAYKKLVQHYHPDKGGDPDLFELITDAYNILSNKEKRDEYDKLTKLKKQTVTSHEKLKDNFNDYLNELTDKPVSPEEKLLAQKEFEREFEKLDSKRGYNRSIEDECRITKKNADRLLNDLELVRAQQMIEDETERLFDEGEKFNLTKFNEVFDRLKEKEVENDNKALAELGRMETWGEVQGSSHYTKFGLDDEDELDNDTNQFCSLNRLENNSNTLTKEEITKIKSNKHTTANYVNNHNYKDKNYESNLEKLIEQRNNETMMYENMEKDDFNTDSNMGGFGIHSELGIDSDRISFLNLDDDNDELMAKYNKLLESRK